MTKPGRPLVASPSQTIGPFFHVGPGATDQLGRMANAGTAGEAIALRIRLLDGQGTPVSDALIELWQANAAGTYSDPATPSGGTAPAFAGFGRLGTDEDGWCRFETIRPGSVRAADGAMQAPHINVCVHARGLLRQLYTRIYFDGDSALDADPLLALVPAERRASLLATRSPHDGTWEFVIHLQGQDETAFFDV